MIDSLLQAALAGLGVSLLLMLLVWLASLRWRDASLVDRFRGFGFVLVAVRARPGRGLAAVADGWWTLVSTLLMGSPPPRAGPGVGCRNGSRPGCFPIG